MESDKNNRCSIFKKLKICGVRDRVAGDHVDNEGRVSWRLYYPSLVFFFVTPPPRQEPCFLSRRYRKGQPPVGDFLSFHEARRYVRKLGLSTQQEWFEWSRDHRPEFIPSAPRLVYKDEGWLSFRDWLGCAHRSRDCGYVTGDFIASSSMDADCNVVKSSVFYAGDSENEYRTVKLALAGNRFCFGTRRGIRDVLRACLRSG